MIRVSSAASQEIKRLQIKQVGIKPVLHIGLQTGCCAAWTYTLKFIDQPQGEDVTVETTVDLEGLTLAVPSQFLPYLEDLTIDYGEDLMGGSFRFTNPHADHTCGCGISFTPHGESASQSLTGDCGQQPHSDRPA